MTCSALQQPSSGLGAQKCLCVDSDYEHLLEPVKRGGALSQVQGGCGPHAPSVALACRVGEKLGL